MLNGAIIGLGNIALKGHLPGYLLDEVRQRFTIVAVLDVVESGREKVRELLPQARFYTRLDDMLAKEKLDFVDICTPPHTHAEYVLTCAAAGVHVICEKPLAESMESAQAISDAVRKAKIVFVPCHQYKYSPLWKNIHDMITGGELGDVVLAQFNVYRLQADTGTPGWNPSWRTDKATSGGGILVDTGAHYFYLAHHFFGAPEKVSALLRTLRHKEYSVEDTALVTLEYPGTLMQINLTWAASARANSATVVGSKGMLNYDGKRLLHTTAQGDVREIAMPDVSDKNQYVAWYGRLFDEFARRVKRKDASSDLLDEAVLVMRMLERSGLSSDQHEMKTIA
jgi:predicted dehydrogenase